MKSVCVGSFIGIKGVVAPRLVRTRRCISDQQQQPIIYVLGRACFLSINRTCKNREWNMPSCRQPAQCGEGSLLSNELRSPTEILYSHKQAQQPDELHAPVSSYAVLDAIVPCGLWA